MKKKSIKDQTPEEISEEILGHDEWAIDHDIDLEDIEIIWPIRNGKSWITYLAKNKAGEKLTATYLQNQKILNREQIKALHKGSPIEQIESRTQSFLEPYEQDFLRPAVNAKGLKHPNVERIYGFTYDIERKQLVVLSEYMPGLTLYDASMSLNWMQLLFLARQALMGIEHIHINQLLHLNIKSSRILVNVEADPLLVKINYGLAIPMQGYKGGYRGTLEFMAHEVIREERDKIDERADLYSLAATLYHCLARKHPLEHRIIARKSGESILSIIEKEKPVSIPPSHYNSNIPPALDRLILDLLQVKPEERKYRDATDVLSYITDTWPEACEKLVNEGTSTLIKI